MAERTDDRTRERESVDGIGGDSGGFDDALGEADVTTTARDRTADTESSSSGRLPSLGIRRRISERTPSLFSTRLFAVMLVVTIAMSLVAGRVLPFVSGSIGSYVGIFLSGFLLGGLDEDRHYVEMGLAAAFSGVLTAVLGAGLGVSLLAAGATASGVAGLLGHYFGRDLRDGLTRDV